MKPHNPDDRWNCPGRCPYLSSTGMRVRVCVARAYIYALFDQQFFFIRNSHGYFGSLTTFWSSPHTNMLHTCTRTLWDYSFFLSIFVAANEEKKKNGKFLRMFWWRMKNESKLFVWQFEVVVMFSFVGCFSCCCLCHRLDDGVDVVGSVLSFNCFFFVAFVVLGRLFSCAILIFRWIKSFSFLLGRKFYIYFPDCFFFISFFTKFQQANALHRCWWYDGELHVIILPEFWQSNFGSMSRHEQKCSWNATCFATDPIVFLFVCVFSVLSTLALFFFIHSISINILLLSIVIVSNK